MGTVLLVPLGGGTAGEVEVGWHLHPDHWGNGYATEAASGAIARGLAAGLPEVLAVVRPENAASQAVCRRLGMQARGLSERYYGTALEVFSAAPDGAAGPRTRSMTPPTRSSTRAKLALPDLTPTARSVMG